MHQRQRITLDPAVMGGKPGIRGMRVTVGTIVGLLAAGCREEEILNAYPDLEKEDLREALAYAAWRVETAVRDGGRPSGSSPAAGNPAGNPYYRMAKRME
ncbi:MAG: DUF433 domain-containing protein [Acidobacteriaceae bacterium]